MKVHSVIRPKTNVDTSFSLQHCKQAVSQGVRSVVLPILCGVGTFVYTSTCITTAAKVSGVSLTKVAERSIAIFKAVAVRNRIPFSVVLGRYVFMVIVFAPIVEEFLFRFFIEKHSLKESWHPFVKASVTSVVFALAHIANPGITIARMAVIGLVGLVCSLAQHHFGLHAAMSVHAGYNMAVVRHALDIPVAGIVKSIVSLRFSDFLIPIR